MAKRKATNIREYRDGNTGEVRPRPRGFEVQRLKFFVSSGSARPSKSEKTYYVRAGYRVEPCTGEAHSNAHIDHCMLCAPEWGVVAVKVENTITVPRDVVEELANALSELDKVCIDCAPDGMREHLAGSFRELRKGVAQMLEAPR